MDASVPIISLSFRQTTLRQACNNVRCSLPRQTGNAFPAGNGIKHKTRKATSKSSCCRLSYSGTASYIFPAVFCGKRGIRTPGALQLNGFQDRRDRPLRHPSGEAKVARIFHSAKSSSSFCSFSCRREEIHPRISVFHKFCVPLFLPVRLAVHFSRYLII